MKIRYDPEVDAAYISFKDNHVQVTIMRVTEDIAIDFGLHEEIVGIEILDASEHLNIKREKPTVELENLIAV
jgi:uncharacterized protein YuzE